MNFRTTIMILAFLACMSLAYAATTGTIEFGTKNSSVTTGIFAYTVNTCSSNADCRGYQCFFDYDNISGNFGVSAGVCNATYVRSCIHDASASDFTVLPDGNYSCVTNTTYRQCSVGNWSSLQNCTSGQICFGGTTSCGTPASGSSGSSSSSGGAALASNTTTAPSPTRLLSLAGPSSVGVEQGKSSMIAVTVKNTGTDNLSFLAFSVQGLNTSWYSVILPPVSLKPSETVKFNISISIPAETEVAAYPFKVLAASGNTSASLDVSLSVLPTATTTHEINATYYYLVGVVSVLDKNLQDTEKSLNKDDVQAVKVLLNNAKSKLKQANTSIAHNDFFSAKLLTDEASDLVKAAQQKLSEARPAPFDYGFWGGIALVIIIITVAIAYLFLPPRSQPKHALLRSFSGKK